MTKVVLLSIKPKWADAILDGEKKWEYRKKPPGIHPPYDMLLYATSPVQEILGEVTVDHEFRDNVENVIRRTITETPHKPNGIRDYFGDRREGCALRVIEPNKFKEPIKLEEHPPMNFKYVDRENIVE